MERLQKILSQAGIASRRASEQLMLEGRVTVNGTTVRELGTKADPSADDIRVDGRRIKLPERHRYLLLNKPRGYVTTRSDPERRPTVMDLLRGIGDYVYPVGRLDYETEGLLILTNDGELAAQLTHPSHEVARVYEARVLGIPDPHDVARLMKGVTIEGRRTQPAQVQLRPGRQEGHAAVRITIREGRNRQIRNMFEAIGHPVDELTRVAIGPIRDSRLKVGHWRNLTPDEIAALKKAAAHEGRTKRETRTGRGGRERQEKQKKREGREGRESQKKGEGQEGRERQDRKVSRRKPQSASRSKNTREAPTSPAPAVRSRRPAPTRDHRPGRRRR